MTTTRERALEAALRICLEAAETMSLHPSAQSRMEARRSRDRIQNTAGAALALPPSPDKLPCGCVNHDGGPYALSCVLMGEMEPNIYSEIVEAAVNWISADADNPDTPPEAWQQAIPVILAAPDMLAALRNLLDDIKTSGIPLCTEEGGITGAIDDAEYAIARATGREG